ncbi:MAG: class I SAM-dependent methyltransferase [Hyphomicrobiaceae bacterium]
MSSLTVPATGAAAADHYLADGFEKVVGMSSRFAAAICCRLLRLQTELGVSGHVVEVGAFEGRFLIALAHALEPGERVVGMDVFTWPNEGVKDRFEANCTRHGIGPDRRVTWKVDSGTITAAQMQAKADGPIRLIHIDGEHTQAALTKDLELATAAIAPGGLIVLDDMLHPGYPTLMVAVHAYLGGTRRWSCCA